MDKKVPNTGKNKIIGDFRKNNYKPIANLFIINGESYSRLFSMKPLKKRPIMEGKQSCQYFHTKGYCFKSCRRKNVHVPKNKSQKCRRTGMGPTTKLAVVPLFGSYSPSRCPSNLMTFISINI